MQLRSNQGPQGRNVLWELGIPKRFEEGSKERKDLHGLVSPLDLALKVAKYTSSRWCWSHTNNSKAPTQLSLPTRSSDLASSYLQKWINGIKKETKEILKLKIDLDGPTHKAHPFNHPKSLKW